MNAQVRKQNVEEPGTLVRYHGIMKPDSGRSLPTESMPGDRSTQRTVFPAVYDLLEEAVTNKVFPGCAFGVLQGNVIRLLDAIGHQTYEPVAPAIQPSTVYDLASLTKVLATTPMAMLLHERRLLKLDQPLVEILPAFASAAITTGALEEARDRVTLRHLLTHSSGLVGYARLFEIARTREELLAACLHMPLQHQPGTFSEYSDIGFILLGQALEVLAGETIDSFCQREVYSRLAMDHTGFLPSRQQRASIPPTERDVSFRRKVIQGEVQDENCWVLGGISGHAGLFGNVSDALRFARAFLASGKPVEDRPTLFQPDTVRLFSSTSGMPPGSSRALGWDTPSMPSSSGRYFSRESIGHLGYAGTSIWIDRLEDVTIVLLTNRTWPSRENQAIRQLRPVFHDRIREALSQQ